MRRKRLKTSHNEPVTQTTVDSLPTEVMVTIMKMLDLNSLLECRLVSKRWKEMTNLVRLKGLSVMLQCCPYCSDHGDAGIFFFTDHSINYSCTLFTSKSIDFIGAQFMKSALSTVRRLMLGNVNLCEQSSWKIFKNALSGFYELNQLQIRKLHFNKNKTLILPNLTILSIDEFNDIAKLTIKAPKLTKLSWHGKFDNVKISVESNITHLSANVSHLSNGLTSGLCRFENCEYFYFHFFGNSSDWNNILTNFNPKEIYFAEFPYKEFVIKQLARASASHPNLRMYISNFRVSDLESVHDLYGENNFISQISTETIIENYAKLSNVVNVINQVNYSNLFDRFGGSFPIDFNNRFVAINNVRVDQIVNNYAEFLKFIRNCKLLNYLEISNTPVHQWFLDLLPECCPYIKILRINDVGLASLDSSFIAKFKYLISYSINHKVPFHLIRYKFESSPKFQHINFMLNKKQIDSEFEEHGILMISNKCSKHWLNDGQVPCILKELFELSAGRTEDETKENETKEDEIKEDETKEDQTKEDETTIDSSLH